MMGDTATRERNQARNGLIFLVAGFVLLLWVWGSWLYRTWQPGVIPPLAAADAIEPGTEEAAVSTPLLLAVAAVVLFLALFGGYVLAKRNSGRRGHLEKRQGRFSASREAPENRPSRDDHS